MISVFSDGSSSGKALGPGGYGFVIVGNDEVFGWGFGGSPLTSNNKQELEGAIQGLTALLHLGLHVNNQVELVSDSEYVIGIANGRFHPLANLEQVAALRSVASKINNLQCRWIRGHTGNKWNEVADRLAGQGKSENQPREIRELKALKDARRDRRLAARAARAAVSEVPTGPGLDK